jgi:hypothetical protein
VGASFSCVARADPSPLEKAPKTRSAGYSSYERQTLRRETQKRGFEIDDEPSGKIIESISVANLEVFEDRDPAPGVLNLFHSTTRTQVVTRELLLHEGDVYEQSLLDETARNLRQLLPLSLVLAVPVKGSRFDRVRLLLVTKDVWSLRLAWTAKLGPGGIESLVLAPAETNFGGMHRLVGTRFELLPLTYSPGVRFLEPWLFGTRHRLLGEANVIVNRQSGNVEGGTGRFDIVKPLFSTRTHWSYGITSDFDSEIYRRYVNAKVATFDAKSTPDNDKIPFVYRFRSISATAYIQRSFGWAHKQDFTVAFAVRDQTVRPIDQEGLDPVGVAEFNRRFLPRGETRVYPYIGYRAYSTAFSRVFDAEALGLQEDFRLGYDIQTRLYPVTRTLGSTRSFLGLFLGAQYTVPLGDGFARAVVESTTERQTDRLTDAQLAAALRIHSPRTGIGRLVFDTSVQNRYENYLNKQSLLGGSGRLRGYPSNFLQGKDVVASNVEFRTRGFSLLSVQLGGVAFYDIADAFNGFANLSPKSAVGFGGRVLFPQFDRIVFRADIGFPLAPHGLLPGVSPYSYYFSFEQAFAVPVVGP